MLDALETSRGLRIAAWIWPGYLAALLVMDALLYPRLAPSVQLYYLGNGLAALLFLALAHWEWMRKRLGQGFLPLMILLVSGTPSLWMFRMTGAADSRHWDSLTIKRLTVTSYSRDRSLASWDERRYSSQ